MTPFTPINCLALDAHAQPCSRCPAACACCDTVPGQPQEREHRPHVSLLRDCVRTHESDPILGRFLGLEGPLMLGKSVVGVVVGVVV